MKKSLNFALINCNVFDGNLDCEISQDAVILVKNESDERKDLGIIENIGNKADVEIPPNYTQIDLKGNYVIPGLINAHAHIMGEGKPRTLTGKSDKSLQRFAWLMRRWIGKKVVMRMMRENATSALNAGVTTIRSLGEPYYYDMELRKDIEEKKKFVGPRILISGPPLCVTGGHGWLIAHIIDSPWEARKAVRENLRKEVDQIKLISTGGVMDSKRIGEAGRPQMTLEEIAAACDEAHRAGIRVAAHAQSTLGIKEALLGGVDTIEHGAELDTECIELFKNNPKALKGYSALVPTLSAPITLLEWGVEVLKITKVQQENTVLVRDGLIKGFRQALREGIKVGAGTDASIPLVPHYDFWKELEYYVQYGNISPKEAIYHATKVNAEILGIDDETGTIEIGKSADLIVLDDNPLENLNVLSTPRMVIRAGYLIDAPKVRKVKQIEKIKRKKEK